MEKFIIFIDENITHTKREYILEILNNQSFFSSYLLNKQVYEQLKPENILTRGNYGNTSNLFFAHGKIPIFSRKLQKPRFTFTLFCMQFIFQCLNCYLLSIYTFRSQDEDTRRENMLEMKRAESRETSQMLLFHKIGCLRVSDIPLSFSSRKLQSWR